LLVLGGARERDENTERRTRERERDERVEGREGKRAGNRT